MSERDAKTQAPLYQRHATPSRMRAAVLIAPGELRVMEKPGLISGEGEVLVRVAMCGTCRTDLKIQEHLFPGQPPYGSFPSGRAWMGTVVEKGRWPIGERSLWRLRANCDAASW